MDFFFCRIFLSPQLTVGQILLFLWRTTELEKRESPGICLLPTHTDGTCCLPVPFAFQSNVAMKIWTMFKAKCSWWTLCERLFQSLKNCFWSQLTEMSELPLIKTPTSATSLIFQKSFLQPLPLTQESEKHYFPSWRCGLWFTPLWQTIFQIYVCFYFLSSNIKLQTIKKHCMLLFMFFIFTAEN